MRLNTLITHSLRSLIAATLILGTSPVGWAQDAPAPDPALDKLLKLDPAALADRIKSMRGEAEAQATEATALLEKATQLDAKSVAISTQLDNLMGQIKALSDAFGLNPPPAEMAAAPAAPAEAMAADMEEKSFTNFAEHVAPIFQARCASCHNEDKRKSGLSVANFAGTMEGGSSGPVIVPGDPDGSRLLRLVMQQEEPFMPPSGDPLSAEEIEILRAWIADGALPDKNAKPTMSAKDDEPVEDENGVFIAAKFSDTPPMPEATLASATPMPTRGVVARAIATNPRSPLAAVGGNREVLIYNLETYEILGALPFPEGDVFSLTFSVNGEILVAGGGQEGDSGICVLWNVRTGERLGTYGQAYDTVLAVDISPDHRLLAMGGPNKKVRVYAVDGGQELYKLEPHTDWIHSVKFTPDGEVLSTADRAGGLFLWQAANGRAVEQLRGHEGAINSMAYTVDSKFLATAGDDGTVRIWDTWAYKQVRSFKAHNAPVLTLDISPTGLIATSGTDRTAKLFNLEGKEQKAFSGLDDWGYQARFGKEGAVVLAGTWSGNILEWSTESGELIKTLNTNPTPAT